MANAYFQFKQFTIRQDRCAMKVTTDACLFGAWAAKRIGSLEPGAGTLLDIGAGTGLLSLMIAQKNESSIDAIEIDKDAYEQALENIISSPWNSRIKIYHADVRNFLLPQKYDIIISNPPFYEKELKGGDARKNVARHNEGMLLQELFKLIKKNLKPDGIFFLLLPYKRNAEIRKILTESELAIRQLNFVRQTTKHDFFRIMLEGKFKEIVESEIQIDDISIKDISPSGEGDQYAPLFKDLLKDYYLHL